MNSYRQPRVTAIIDNYNYGRFLPEAINSVINQTHPCCEIIVVDDGSCDNSREVIAAYGSRVVPVLKENGGQGSAFNAGFAVSQGDIICFLDSDDVWLPTKIEKVVARFVECENADFIYHAYCCVDAQLRPISNRLPTIFLEGEVRERVLHAGGCWPYPPPSAFAIRRSVLESYMPIPEELFRTCADACLAYCTPVLSRVAAIREILCYYRMHGSNIYASIPNPAKDCLQAQIRAERYRLNIEGANLVLSKLGRKERFRVQDHAYYLATKYFTKMQDRPSWASVSWKLARASSLGPSFLRWKSVARFWIESLGF